MTDDDSRSPLLFETSVRGVFAVGDVRHGSVKRVASAVGEGSVVVQQCISTLCGLHCCTPLRSRDRIGAGIPTAREMSLATA